MELKLSDDIKLEVELKDGTKISLREPSVDEVQAFQKDIDEKKVNEIQAMSDLLVAVGFPQERIGKLSISNMGKVVKTLVQALEKKS